jgi:hypothetical protein
VTYTPKALGELQELARQHGVDVLEILVSIVEDESAPAGARVSAACAILDRGYGKPTQPIVQVDANRLSDEELEAIIRSAGNNSDEICH